MVDEQASDTSEVVETGTEDAEPAFNMEAASDRIADQLFPGREKDEVDAPDEVHETKATVSASVTPAMDVPKTWPVEMRDHWGKTPREVQDYWGKREKQMIEGLEQYKQDATLSRTFKEVVAPFSQILQAQGLDAPQAVHYLLNAHSRLTQGSMESRAAAYHELGQSLGLQQQGQSQNEMQPIDRNMMALQQEMASIKQDLMARHNADYQTAYTKISQDVDAFASDAAHPHFNAVADDIVLLLKTGLPLQEAYEKAVWANPLTREKEVQARFLTETGKRQETARLNALPKARAAKANVRGVNSSRSPKEALGSMEDTIKSTLSDIRQRIH
jgi:hypothetical protein